MLSGISHIKFYFTSDIEHQRIFILIFQQSMEHMDPLLQLAPPTYPYLLLQLLCSLNQRDHVYPQPTIQNGKEFFHAILLIMVRLMSWKPLVKVIYFVCELIT